MDDWLAPTRRSPDAFVCRQDPRVLFGSFVSGPRIGCTLPSRSNPERRGRSRGLASTGASSWTHARMVQDAPRDKWAARLFLWGESLAVNDSLQRRRRRWKQSTGELEQSMHASSPRFLPVSFPPLQVSLNLTISLPKPKKNREEKASPDGWIERDKLQENAGSRL